MHMYKSADQCEKQSVMMDLEPFAKLADTVTKNA